MEIEVTDAKVMMAFQFFLRATNDCTRRCDVLKLDDEINGDDRDCLKKCALYHAGATNAHNKFERSRIQHLFYTNKKDFQ